MKKSKTVQTISLSNYETNLSSLGRNNFILLLITEIHFVLADV